MSSDNRNMIGISKYTENLGNIIHQILGSSRSDTVKAAILTWCNNNGATNYGQVLQCYAMQTYIEKLGMQTKILLYQNKPVFIPDKDMKRVESFQVFINKYIHLSKPLYSKKMVEEETADCSLLICGSDQIWNPLYYDPIWYLDFGDESQIRMAISPSGIFYENDDNKDVLSQISNHVAKLDYVSMREKCGATIMSCLADIDVDVMPDPSLFLSKDEWGSIAIDPDIHEDYIFVYFLGEIKPFVDEIRRIRQLFSNAQIITIPSNITVNQSIKGFTDFDGVGPAEFIGLIKNAKAVVTDSFHGVVFGNIFGITVYCAKRKQKGFEAFGAQERLENLEKEFGFRLNWIYPQKECDSQNDNYKTGGVKVSVIMPVYNSEKYLQQSLESVVNQSYRNLEIICVDDGSSDNSADIIREFQRRDSRIKLIQQHNQYAGIARNNGFMDATGEYAIFLDSDDLFEADLFEKMVNKAVSAEADIVICGSDGFDDEGNKYTLTEMALDYSRLPEKEVFSIDDVPTMIFRLSGGHSWDKMYSSNYLRDKGLYFYRTRIAEDLFFTEMAMAEAARITAVREELVHYRMDSLSSTWSSREQKWSDLFDSLLALRSELIRRNLYLKVERDFLNLSARYLSTFIFGMHDIDVFNDYCAGLQKYNDKIFHFEERNSEYYYSEFEHRILMELLRGGKDSLLKILSFTEQYIDKYSRINCYKLISSYGTIDALVRINKNLTDNKHWRLPVEQIPSDSNVAVYGYGDVGKDYCYQIIRDGHLGFVGVFDRNYEQYSEQPYQVLSPEDATHIKFDYIVIAVVEKKTADSIKEYLEKKGVCSEKILWFDPGRKCMDTIE